MQVDNPIKRVVFKFPVSYCGESVFEVLSPKETTDETVVILRGVKTDSHISVDLDVEKIGLNHKL